MNLSIFKLQQLKPDIEAQMLRQNEAQMGELLPTLGPLFGIVVILFSIWDYTIDAEHAPLTLAVRLLLVLAGSIAYRPLKAAWTPTQRYGYVYFTHVSAVIIAEFLLQDGFLYGLAGITACVFPMSVVTLSVRTFLLTVTPPFFLFLILAGIKLPMLGFANGAALYFFSICLAFVILLVIRFLRQKAFLLQHELTHISRHDSLTGVCNRRYLTELAKREIALARRHGRPLAVAMIDIDRFKRINDTYGHGIGDTVIKSVTDTCLATLRSIDHVGRFGGEEFVCLLPETDAAQATACCERLRRNIEDSSVPTPQGAIRFTVSIGVAVLGPWHADWNALLKDVDTALYRAKDGGRNRVEFAVAGLLPLG
jgi:diguanylate cyclase (GGDEF)-like protein